MFIYQKTPSLRIIISPNVHNPPKKLHTFFDTTGFYRCKRCKACKTMNICSRKVNTCPCGLQYVGRTTRKLGNRINKHLNNIKNGFPKHSPSNHFRIYHNRDPRLASFCGIDRVEPHWRGANMKQKISKN